jgi:hypothetical protein
MVGDLPFGVATRVGLLLRVLLLRVGHGLGVLGLGLAHLRGVVGLRGADVKLLSPRLRCHEPSHLPAWGMR